MPNQYRCDFSCVFNGESLTELTHVVIKDGYISSIGPAVPEGAEEFNAKGATLLPGLTSVTTCASVAVGPGGLLPKVVIIRDEDVIHGTDPQEGISFVDRMVEKGAEYTKVILEMPPATEKMLTVEQVRLPQHQEGVGERMEQ
ncbi:MAG: hypothetical protein IJ200_08755 [Prevotella sp.]|nr:hypothetical protein [Prevotella sp.]